MSLPFKRTTQHFFERITDYVVAGCVLAALIATVFAIAFSL